MASFEETTFLEKPEINKEYKYNLRLSIDRNDELRWDMFVFVRDTEKKLKNFFEWKFLTSDYPKESEITFTKMKNSIFEKIDENFFKQLRRYREENFSEAQK